MPKRLQLYATAEIEVTFDPNLCRHTGICVRGLNSVFDIRRKRWIDLAHAPADVIAAQVARCPSGALQSRMLTSDDSPPDHPVPHAATREGDDA